MPRSVATQLALLGSLCALPLWTAGTEDTPRVQGAAAIEPQKLVVTVGKSLVIDSPVNIERLSFANDQILDAVGIKPKEVLINGKAPGETSLIIWQQGGARLVYDLTVRPSPFRLEAVRQQLARDFPNDEINVTYENDTAFVRGTVKDTFAADRVMAIAASLGKAVNLLRVEVPPVETQILLRVRFANVDRSASTDLGLSLASYAFNQATQVGAISGASIGKDSTTSTITLSDAMNILFFRPDLKLGAAIKALESKRLLETLAEPNVMAINGKAASFVSGGEFPIPMVSGLGQVNITFREFGIRINFLPRVTPRGTIQLQVAPEVSALDYANAVTFQGYTIPALNTRRVQTEVELETGQSFAIAGLLDNRLTDTMAKVPGLANIPLLGKLFQSKSVQRNNSELLVIVTPEIVRPIEAGKPVPALNYPQEFMPQNTGIPIRHPGLDQTGPVPVKPPVETMPIEQLIQQRKEGQPAPQPTAPPYLTMPPAGSGDAQTGSAPAASPPTPKSGGGNR